MHEIPYQVAIVGYSLTLCQFPCINGCEVHIFRKPGGKISDIYSDSVFYGFRERCFPQVILQIGENDLVNLEVVDVCHALRDLVSYAQLCLVKVSICTFEFRNYPAENRFRISEGQYRVKVYRINRYMCRTIRK